MGAEQLDLMGAEQLDSIHAQDLLLQAELAVPVGG